MINFVPHEVNSKDLLLEIIESKNNPSKEMIENAKEIILESYQSYEDNSKYLENLRPNSNINEDVANALRNVYKSNRIFKENRTEFLDGVKNKQTIRCPYCFINNFITLDHFFSKNEYPEYSFYFPNLIPSCFDCNNKKSTKIFNGSRERLFVNVYYDEIPDYKFLEINLQYNSDDPIPAIKINLNFEEESEINTIIEHHFNELFLKERYIDNLNEAITEVTMKINEYYGSNISLDTIRQLLHSEYRVLKEKWGENYWITCLYYEYAHNEIFIQKALNIK